MLQGIRYLLCLTVFTAIAAGCASRLPSPQTSERLIRKHFVAYGKAYPKTIFSSHRVSKVEILTLEEDRKGLVQAEAFLTLEGEDSALAKVRVTLKKRTLRWKVEAWEDLSPSPISPSTPPSKI